MIAKAPMLAIAACVLLAVGFYFLLWNPADERQTELEDETAELESQATGLRNEIAVLEEIRDNEDDYREAVATLADYVPEGPDQSSVISQLQQAADAAGVDIDTMTFGTPERLEDAPDTGAQDTVVARIDTSVQVQGAYFEVVDFLRRIEVDVPRAVLFTQLNLAEGDDGYPSLAATWTGDLFAIVPVVDTVEPGEGDIDEEDTGADDGDEAGGDDDADDFDDDLDDDDLQEAAG